MAPEPVKGKVIYAFSASPERNPEPILESPKEHKFLRYLFGTYREIEGLDKFDRHASEMRKNAENKDWLRVKRNGLDMLRFVEESMDECEQAQEEVKNHRFKWDWEVHGTIVYGLASFPILALAPYVGITLLVDSAIRTSRMAFRSDPPVGLVGTVREAYQHLNKK